MRHLSHYFSKNPVIAAVRNEKDLKKALKSDVYAIVIMKISILKLDEIVKKIQDHDKLVFIHIDLMVGLGRDKEAVKYLAYNELCDGIISTKGQLVKEAMKYDLMGIQRLFLLDSEALRTGRSMLDNNSPSAIEVLPGVAAPYLIKRIDERISCPIIAGGLIRTKEEVDDLVDQGVFAISTGEKSLW
ncbi:glycerol-3-phosphate responsive antiterminator [Halanaerobiaceae bacterium Z-7014]|uniref:Glycerol-3-phosphate responsive antiterminator n=1 Tax=Halonatronomonas betaini TaxID=2778430 RepID=A0A931APS6_9FIRM|nr:glycerol-3-phosphate responsive antiterminator [Halonatronomonas betaini]MBF8435591.1 glycerol-3-phosphate responsive antiterminator [Halonatronomonas betaini]